MFALCYVTMLYENFIFPDNKVHVAHKGPTWVLSAPGGTHVGPINLVIKVIIRTLSLTSDNSLIVYSTNSWELTKFTLNFPNSIVPLLGQYCWHLTCKDSYCMHCGQDHGNQWKEYFLIRGVHFCFYSWIFDIRHETYTFWVYSESKFLAEICHEFFSHMPSCVLKNN